MTATVADIIRVMDDIAPRHLAEDWDNVGLQLGDATWPVEHIRVALDPLGAVVRAACESGANLLITHHPLFFKPLKRLDLGTPLGALIENALTHRLAVLAAHTNLDSTRNGINDALAYRLELCDLNPLGATRDDDRCTLVVSGAAKHDHRVRAALSDCGISSGMCSGGPKIQDISKPVPAAGNFNTLPGEVIGSEAAWTVEVPRRMIAAIAATLHTRVERDGLQVTAYPQVAWKYRQGIGRVGNLRDTTDLGSLAARMRQVLNLPAVKVAGRADLAVNRVALCSGSGSSLLSAFFKSGAQVYISADLHYHDARAVEDAGCGLIDVGHFASEHFFVNVLAGRLRDILAAKGLDVLVDTCDLEKDPFFRL